MYDERYIILPVVLYGCETWSLTMTDERRLRVFENRVLTRIYGPMRDEVTWEWKNYIMRSLYCSPNIVRVIKPRRMRWAGHVACMGQRRGIYRVLVGKPEGKDQLGDPGLDGRMILERIFRKWDVGVWTGSSWLRMSTGSGYL